jgi:hypothetical protein
VLALIALWRRTSPMTGPDPLPHRERARTTRAARAAVGPWRTPVGAVARLVMTGAAQLIHACPHVTAVNRRSRDAFVELAGAVQSGFRRR